jgi:hypothetical protein
VATRAPPALQTPDAVVALQSIVVMPHPNATLNAIGRYNRPPGGAPRNHYWDETIGEWRHNDTNDIRAHNARRAANAAHRRTTPEARAAHVEQQARGHAARQEARRHRGHNRARCNDEILKPGFDRASVKPHDGGTLGDVKCAARWALARRTRRGMGDVGRAASGVSCVESARVRPGVSSSVRQVQTRNSV